MIIEIPDDNSIVKWKMNDNDEWKSAEISDLIIAYEGRLKGDAISREALKEDFKSRLADCNEWIEKAKDKETKIRASAVKTFIGEVIMTINNAQTVSDRYEEGYAQGYIDGSTGADWRGDTE